MEKYLQYSTKLQSHIAGIFREDCEWQINLDELSEEANATAFFHALANIVPTRFYSEMVDADTDILRFNHIANHLIFQLAEKEK